MQEEQIPLNSRPLFRTQDGEDFEVPAEGSLGLLALGYVGLMAWRQKRNEVMQQPMTVKISENHETPR